MKVLFDGTCIEKNPAGIGNYAYQLLKEFVHDGQHEVTVICRNPEYIPAGENIRTLKLANRFLKLLPFDIVSFTGNYDVYHQPNYIPHCFKGRKVITVHDLSYLICPQYHPWERVRMLKQYEQRMKNADIIITDSKSSKREIIEHWHVKEEKIKVVYLGADERYYNYTLNAEDEGTLRHQWNIPDRYLLFVGTIEPRKNIQRLIQAFRIFKDKTKDDIKLVLAGGKGWLSEEIYREVNRCRLQEEIIFTGYFPEELKPALYAKAQALVYPSLYEGFGLPILEAMAVGTAVMTSEISSMPEVAGDVGVYCNPYEVEDIAGKIIQVFSEAKTKDDILRQAKSFSWGKCFNGTVASYS